MESLAGCCDSWSVVSLDEEKGNTARTQLVGGRMGGKGYFWTPFDYIGKTKNCADCWTVGDVEKPSTYKSSV